MNIYHCIILAISLGSVAESANILGIFPLAGKSHFIMFQRLFIALAERGHDIDIVTHFPMKDPPKGYNQLSIKGSIPIMTSNISVETLPAMNLHGIISFIVDSCGAELCDIVFKTPVLQKLKTTNKKYDLVITEIFGSDCMLGFGHLFKAPTISLISSAVQPWGNDRIGNPDNPSYIANYFHESIHMDLFGRIINTLELLYAKTLYNLAIKESDRVAKEFFGPNIPDLNILMKNTSLILTNSYFVTNQARPVVPNYIEVGGLHIEEPKPLPKHLNDLIQVNSKIKGVIYLTMGSMIMTESFPVDRLQGMFDAFAELPYKVLWKANFTRFPKNLRFPNNIHFETWMPQMDILCHPNVKLFVSHGGLMGSQEAVYCGVPRLGIPLFADQESNIRNSEALGLTIRVAYNNITKESILDAARKLLNDPKYTENAKRASRLFKDRPMSALDTAVFWTEYVIRNHGAPELRITGADLPWYQFYLIDVILILSLVSLLLIYLTVLITKLILRILVCNPLKQKND